jgi:hypothetical protein
MGAEKIQNRDLWDVWRSSSTASGGTWIEVTFERDVTLTLIGAFGLNVSTGAQWRVQTWADSGKADQTYDSGTVDLCLWQLAIEDRDWASDNFWIGRPDQEDWQRRRRLGILPLGGGKKCRLARFEIFDANNPDGFVEMGRLFLGNSIEPDINMAFGYQTGVAPKAVQLEAPTGHRSVYENRPGRTASLKLDSLRDSERDRLLDMFADHGETGEVVWVPDPEDGGALQRQSFLATLARGHSVITRYPDSTYKHETSIQMREWI